MVEVRVVERVAVVREVVVVVGDTTSVSGQNQL